MCIRDSYRSFIINIKVSKQTGIQQKVGRHLLKHVPVSYTHLVELAQLRYRASRLAGLGRSLSRLGGGIGTRGPGEKKLEMDLSLIHI